MRTHLSLPLLGAAALTIGALVLQLSRKPDPKPPIEPIGPVAADVESAFLDRLRERGL